MKQNSANQYLVIDTAYQFWIFDKLRCFPIFTRDLLQLLLPAPYGTFRPDYGYLQLSHEFALYPTFIHVVVLHSTAFLSSDKISALPTVVKRHDDDGRSGWIPSEQNKPIKYSISFFWATPLSVEWQVSISAWLSSSSYYTLPEQEARMFGTFYNVSSTRHQHCTALPD